MPFLWSASRRARPVGGRTFSYQGCTALMPKIFLPPLGAQIGARHPVRRRVGC